MRDGWVGLSIWIDRTSEVKPVNRSPNDVNQMCLISIAVGESEVRHLFHRRTSYQGESFASGTQEMINVVITYDYCRNWDNNSQLING